jgi:hypothetical protein
MDFLPVQGGFSQFFNAMFLSGSAVLIIAVMNRKQRSHHFFVLLTLMLGSLVALVNSTNLLHFFHIVGDHDAFILPSHTQRFAAQGKSHTDM